MKSKSVFTVLILPLSYKKLMGIVVTSPCGRHGEVIT